MASTTDPAAAPVEDVPTTEDKYQFSLPVDDVGKAKVLRIFSIRRPHMRAFHFAWFSFFLAFFGWFALAPLQKGIRDAGFIDGLTNGSRFKTQNIIAVLGTIIMRLAVGPFCDRFGPRTAQSLLLSIFSLPVFLVATATKYWQWTTARFFIGFIGAAFVVTQFWTSIMFSSNIVATANATSGGWGNLGGGVTNALMPLVKKGMTKAAGGNENRGWRLSMIFPGIALVATSIAMFFLSDDLPQGNYADLLKEGKKKKTNPFKAMGKAATNWRVWILFLLYAACFGIELVMNGNLATYFSDDKIEAFGLDESTAGLIAGLFGLMNFFARSVGGILSDVMAHKFGMRGRLWAFFFVQLCEGIMFVVFSRIRVLGGAIPALIGFSLFVQMAEGCTFGVVPFVDPPITGAIAGIVGAGGNFGAVIGNLFLAPKKVRGISNGFRTLGFIVIGSAFLIPLLHFPQYGSMFLKPKQQKIVEDIADEVAEEEAAAASQ
ncbi:High affinity nitrate transporter 2.5 [Gracilariopsis chorda]|uniref:High affinity nitrate transporter 2.5 n=1 Tax=Gracilariopsis chorda TaxID=448386 RepID=A0A2V3J3W7_9FLOR|nr:High affinity nitrate transporter 2.5 [Gracilariopsis chorda]|eukprot:PXF49156.1 High affinity nitrate transporter 2.5 [Gracilariopsis chorda]